MALKSGARVLIGLAEALAAPEVAWSLLDAGFEVHAFTTREARPALRRCPSVRLHPMTSASVDVDAATAELSAIVDSVEPQAVMPLDDSSLWLCSELDLPPSVALVGPGGPQAGLALDKRVQIGAALGARLPVPSTRICETVAEAFSPWPTFPVMVKPCFAIQRRGQRLETGQRRGCANAAELERLLEAAYGDGAPFFLQPYIAGVGEGLFGLAQDGAVVGWSAHRRVRMMTPHGSGSSACVPHPVDPALAEAAETMLRTAGWNGLFMIEFLRESGGEAWFVEINGRAWGSMALARRMGFEYPAWAVRSRLDDGFRPPIPEPREPILCRHLGRELVHLVIVMRGPRSIAPSGWPSRTGTLRDVLTVSRRDRWYNLRRGRLPLFVDDSANTVTREIRRALG